MAEPLSSSERGPIRSAALHPLGRRRSVRGGLTLAERTELHEIESELAAEGVTLGPPATFGECPTEGQCGHVSCRHNLYLDVLPSGAVKLTFADVEIDEIDVDLCGLRQAAAGAQRAERDGATGMETPEIGRLLNVTGSSVQQYVHSGLATLKRRLGGRFPRIPAASGGMVPPTAPAPAAVKAPAPEQTETIDVQQERHQVETDAAPHPGVVLRRYIVERGLSQGGLARQLGRSPALVNHIISGRNPMTASTAWMLSRVFGTEPRFWMDLQVAYDLARARPGVSPAAGAGSTSTVAGEAPAGEHL
jgi:addiction module HigA family antidote